MSNPKYIKTWEELSKEVSPTHVLEIEIELGCGWIRPKEDTEFNHNTSHYLSTHTFYGSHHKYYEKILRDCGFNITLANWDELGW